MRDKKSVILKPAAFTLIAVLINLTLVVIDSIHNPVMAVTEADCRSCHGDSLFTRHHQHMGTPIDGDPIYPPETDFNRDGQIDTTYYCWNCHVIDFSQGFFQMNTGKNCPACHTDVPPGHSRPTPGSAHFEFACQTCHGGLASSMPAEAIFGDVMSITNLASLTDPDSSASITDISADFVDQELGNGSVYLDDNEAISIFYNEEPANFTDVTIQLYVNNPNAIPSIRVYAYHADGNTVDVTSYQDFTATNNGWQRFNVTDIAQSMAGNGWMKFRVINTTSDRFSLTEGYMLVTLIGETETATYNVLEDVCFQCHNDPANSENGLNIWQQYNSTDDIYEGFDAKKGYYSRVNTKHDIDAYDAAYSGAKVECQSCHHPHFANRERKLINPDDRKTPFSKTIVHPAALGGATMVAASDSAVLLTNLASSAAPDSSGTSTDDIATDLADLSFHQEYTLTNSQAIALRFDQDAGSQSQVVLRFYVKHLSVPDTTVRIYPYLSGADDVNTGAYMDYAINSNGWVDLDVSSIADTMAGYGWMKFRITAIHDSAGIPEAGLKPASGGELVGEQIPDYVSFCLQCHDNTWAADGSVSGPSVAIKNVAEGYLDPRVDEHGAASGSGNSTLRGPYASYGSTTGVAPLPCTECHNPHGGDGIYNLRTLTNQYGREITLTSENIDTNEVAHWCSHCHDNPMNQLGSNKGKCFDCHKHGGGKF